MRATTPTLALTALLAAPSAVALVLPAAPPAHGIVLPRAATPNMLFGGGDKDGGGGGGMPNMMETIKKAQQVGEKVKELQEELAATEIEAVAADGGVTVVVTGAQVPISVTVTPELLAQGPDAVSDAVSSATKEAHSNSMECARPTRLPLPPTTQGRALRSARLPT